MEKRIQSIIKNHNIDIEVLSDFIGAVVIAERLYGDNKFEVDIDRFASQFTNFGFKANTNEGISFLPKVQIMRIFVDSIGLYLSRKDKKIEGLHLTMPSSKVVGTGRILTGVSRYSDESECEKMLKLLEYKKDDFSDCEELFNYISEKLKCIRNSKFYFMFKDYDFSKVYLPAEFNSYGFSVSTEVPNNLKSINKVDRLRCFENNFSVQFCNAFIDGIYQVNLKGKVMDNILRLKALSYLDDMVTKGSQYLPIGLDTVSSKIDTANIPKHKNNNDFNLFSKVFKINVKSNRTDVEKVISMLSIL